MAVCVSVLVLLGRCCLLLAVAGCVCGGAVPLVRLVRCRRVDGVGGRRDFRRPRCLPWVILSGWRVSLVPVACFALVVVVDRHGLIVIGCCRRGSASSSWAGVVVVSPYPACLRVSSSSVFAPWGLPPLIVSLIVSLLVFSPRLACRAAGRRAGRVLSPSRAARCLGCRPLGSARSRGGGSSYPSACLPPRYPAGVALPLAWRGVAAFPPSHVARAMPLASLLACPVSISAGAGGGVSCLRLAFPRYAFRPASLVERRGAIFFPCRLFRFSANQRGMRACSRS